VRPGWLINVTVCILHSKPLLIAPYSCKVDKPIGCANAVQLQSRMDKYFNQLVALVDERKTSSRIRFLLLDTIDLRKVRPVCLLLTFIFLHIIALGYSCRKRIFGHFYISIPTESSLHRASNDELISLYFTRYAVTKQNANIVNN